MPTTSCSTTVKPNNTHYLHAAILILATLVAYACIPGNEFINIYDDDVYVTANQMVLNGVSFEGVRWAFSAFDACNWNPVTWFSHMLDVQLFGLSPSGHHATSLILHTGNVLLVYFLLFKLTGFAGRSFFVAALFALHPLHVESVAWVAERKDLLAACFGLLALHAYVRYSGLKTLRPYLLLLFFAAMSLMSKPMLVTLPFLLLILDWWPLGRFQTPVPPNGSARTPGDASFGTTLTGLMKEKLPLFAMSSAIGIVTIISQRAEGGLVRMQSNPLSTSLPNAFVALCSYLRKTVLPHDLAVFYPLSPLPPSPAIWLAALLALCAISFLAIKSRRQQPWFLAGWLWFLVTLMPVIGIVRVGFQSMADRYTYLPLIGIFIILVWGTEEIRIRFCIEDRVGKVLGVVIILICSGLTWQQSGYWRSEESLFARALAVTQDNWLAHNNYGTIIDKAGRHEEAYRHYTESLRIKADYEVAHYNLGLYYKKAGNREQAAAKFRQAIALAPEYTPPHLELGELLENQGDLSGALAVYEHGLSVIPDFAPYHYGAGSVLAKQRRFDQAIKAFRETIRLFPWYHVPYMKLAALYQSRGEHAQAMELYHALRRYNPAEAENLMKLMAIGQQ